MKSASIGSGIIFPLEKAWKSGLFEAANSDYHFIGIEAARDRRLRATRIGGTMTRLSLLIAAALTASTTLALAAEPIIGNWKTEAGDTAVIAPCATGYCI